MKFLFIFLMITPIGNSILNPSPTLNCESNITELENRNRVYARVYTNSASAELRKDSEQLIHDFDCSIPKWRKYIPITAFEVSEEVELVLYEHENYKGESVTFSHFKKEKNLRFPRKFGIPGSIKVLYKGKEKCISNINQKAENALDYILIEEQTDEIVNYNTQLERNKIFVNNNHPSRAIFVRYRINGRSQAVRTVLLDPKKKKQVLRYFVRRPVDISIIDAKFLD